MFGQGLTIASSWTASSQNLSLFDHNSLTVLSLSVDGSTRIRLVTILCAKFAWFLATSNSDTRLWFIFYLCPNHSPLALLLLPFHLTLLSFCFVIRGKRVIKRQSRCEDDSFFEQRSRDDWKKWFFERRIFIVFFGLARLEISQKSIDSLYLATSIGSYVVFLINRCRSFENSRCSRIGEKVWMEWFFKYSNLEKIIFQFFSRIFKRGRFWNAEYRWIWKVTLGILK